jgi:hypothetical protein
MRDPGCGLSYSVLNLVMPPETIAVATERSRIVVTASRVAENERARPSA